MLGFGFVHTTRKRKENVIPPKVAWEVDKLHFEEKSGEYN